MSNKASQAVQDWLANKRAILGSDIYKKVRGPAAHKTTARVGEKRTREDAGIVTPEEEGEGHDEKRLETAEVQEILLSIATSHMAPVQSGVNNGQSSDTSQSDGDNGGPHGDVKPGEPGGTAVATQDGGLDSRHELSQILAAIDNAVRLYLRTRSPLTLKGTQDECHTDDGLIVYENQAVLQTF